MNNSPEAPTKPSKTFKIVISVFSAAVLFILVFFFLPNPFLTAQDVARNLTTSTPSDVENLVSRLKLTDKAKFIFGAVDPQIEASDAFNFACTTTEASVASLGCFDPNTQKIHIYRVESEELAGEVEATAAHELLHAAWERLSYFDHARLEPLLLEVYNSEAYHDQLAESTKEYAADAILTELHSQIAERIKDLPDELEKHYAQYFEDQDLIVSYFDQYSSVFEKLMSEADALLKEIDTERTALMQQADDYEAWLDDYNSRVNQFNACARDPDCSLINFEIRRDEFVSEGRRIDEAYAAYESARAALNAKIDTYNSSVQHLKDLDYALDSRASPTTTLETKEN